MKTTNPKVLSLRSCALAVAGLLLWMTGSTAWAAQGLDDILSRVSARVADSLERFSETRCTEKVNQQKLSPDGKVERDINSTYDYLVIFTNAGGELSLDESRKPQVQETRQEQHTAAGDQRFRDSVSDLSSLLRGELSIHRPGRRNRG